MTPHRPNNRSWRIAWWILFGVIFVVILAIRIRLLGLPLERDEGEYAYAGQLLLDGVPPYRLAYNMKFPGTYVAYALCMSIFGQSAIGVHLGLLIVNAATIALMFFLGRRLLDEIAGIAGAASYAILSLGPTVLGFAGHATHFVVLPALGGAILLLGALDRQSIARFFWSGLFFGLAVIMKQPGAAFVMFGLSYIVFVQWKRPVEPRRLLLQVAVFLGGVIVPTAVTGLWLWRSGVFDKFWFWCVEYAREYGSRVSISLGWEVLANAIPRVVGATWALWGLAFVGIISSAFVFKSAATKFFVFGWLVCSALGVSAGFYFRPHYFILLLPALSLFVGTIASSLFQATQSKQTWLKFGFFGLFAGALTLPLFAERDFFFQAPLDIASRLVNGTNPFPECVRIAQFLRERTSASDTIAVLGSEPQIYFYAHRRAASGYIYAYPLMEPHRFARQMQEEMVREIETAHPKFVVFVQVDTSWLVQPDSHQMVFEWFTEYSARELKPAGLVNIVSGRHTDYYLPYASEMVTPSPYRITIYERKS
ncbi:MAG: glycosyltransferase family 39 protein [Spartobacteria bacterium]